MPGRHAHSRDRKQLCKFCCKASEETEQCSDAWFMSHCSSPGLGLEARRSQDSCSTDGNITPTGTEQESLDGAAAQGPTPNTGPCFKALLFLKGHKKP